MVIMDGMKPESRVAAGRRGFLRGMKSWQSDDQMKLGRPGEDRVGNSDRG